MQRVGVGDAVRRQSRPPLPRRVRGAVTDYEVRIEVLPEGTAGQHSSQREAGGVLRIDKHLNADARWQVFFHELVHKWETETGFKVRETETDGEQDSDADRLATAIYADFRRNGWKLPGEK